METNKTSRDPEEAMLIMAKIYQSRFIGVDDLKEAGRPVKLKILSVETEQLKSIMHKGRKIDGAEKGVLIFDRPEGKKREVILNKTSYRALVEALGKKAKGWIGASVELAAGKVNGKDAVLVTAQPREKSAAGGTVEAETPKPPQPGGTTEGAPEAAQPDTVPPGLADLSWPEDEEEKP